MGYLDNFQLFRFLKKVGKDNLMPKSSVLFKIMSSELVIEGKPGLGNSTDLA